MKKTFLIITTLVCGLVFGQQTQQVERDGLKSDTANQDYKSFTASNGTLVRSEFVILEDLKLSRGLFGYQLNTSIEKVSVGEESRLYYNISAFEYGRDYSAHIPVNHLNQVLEALDILLAQSAEDRKIGTKRFHNYFVTENDFSIGYYTQPIKKGVNVWWYISLERYGLLYEFKFWQEEQFYKAVKSMKTAYDALKNSQ